MGKHVRPCLLLLLCMLEGWAEGGLEPALPWRGTLSERGCWEIPLGGGYAKRGHTLAMKRCKLPLHLHFKLQ